ncbi:MAG TPA: hypothetical protein VFW33_21645 [Gemmataceae bacterium]|nr:hypothetical protein [Gemmataceae bacterium]
MRRLLGCAGLALALGFLPAASAQDKKADADKAMSKDDKDKPKDKKEAVEKMHVAGQVTGKLTQWGSSDKGFTVQVELVYYVLNEGEYRALVQDQAKLATMNPRDVAGRVNTLEAIAGHQARLYNQKKEKVNVDFLPSDEMKVRTLHPLVYDDKGKPKKLTRKELDELKGPDKKLPGYTADAGDIKQDMIVTVYIEKKKPTKTKKDKDEKTLTDIKPEALMLVIVADPAAAK